MIKNRFLKNLLLLTVTSILLSLTACSSDDNDIDNTAALTTEENAKYATYVTPEMENILTKTLQVTINRGINPPDVTGYFLMEANCAKSTITGDPFVGTHFYDYKINMYGQKDLKVNLLGYEVGARTDKFYAEHIADGTFITGEGNKFSIFFIEAISSSDGYNVQVLTVLSGEVDKDSDGKTNGFKNLQYVYLMKDNAGRPNTIPNGSARLFEDTYVDLVSKEEFEVLLDRPKSASMYPVSSFSLIDLK